MLAKAGVPVTVVLDSAVGYHMEVADLCITGAEGVLENGGIINKVRVEHRGEFLLWLGRVYGVGCGADPDRAGYCRHVCDCNIQGGRVVVIS